MEISNLAAIKKIQELLKTPQNTLEREFSPYFYRYYGRYSNSKRFNGYLALCHYLFLMTKARGAVALDLGCGFGLMAALLGLYGAKEVVGYDLNIEKIELFKKFMGYLDKEIQNVKPVLGDTSMIDYPDGYFDVVITNETFSHVRDMEKSIKEVYRVLKSGGRFLIRDGNNSLFLLGRIKRRSFWRSVEQGPVDPSWFRSTDIPLPYVEIRRKMINEKFPHIDPEKIDLLSKETAGMFGDEISEAVRDFEKKGKIVRKPIFPYRNPVTGEYPEKEINPLSLKRMLQNLGFKVSFIPYFYPESFRDLEAAVKRFYYWIEKYFPMGHLFLSPGFGLLGQKALIDYQKLTKFVIRKTKSVNLNQFFLFQNSIFKDSKKLGNK